MAQAVTVPDLEIVAVVVDLSIFPLSCTCVDRIPAPSAAHAAPLTPVQPHLFEQLTARSVLNRNTLYGLIVQPYRAVGIFLNITGRKNTPRSLIERWLNALT